MSSRSRSYTARLRQARAYRPPRTWPTWLTTPGLPALLALAAEAGHLAAALVEWPAATARGLFHILAAAALGSTAVGVYLTPTRRHFALALIVTATAPACWLAAPLTGLTPYYDYPTRAAAIQTAIELAAVVLIASTWRAATGNQQAPSRTTAAARRGRQPQRLRV